MWISKGGITLRDALDLDLDDFEGWNEAAEDFAKQINKG